MTNPNLRPHRCAIYFAPLPDSPWGRAGSTWLGRCAATNEKRPLPLVAGLAPLAQQQAIAEPARYGWHATLKAPFSMKPGVELQDVELAMKRLAQNFEPFALPRLQVVQMGPFLALRPSQACPKLQALAAACVMQLHGYAQPLDDAELTRRRRSPLTAEQDLLLQQWGYPWVLDQFRFHFSLTGAIDTWSQSDIDDLKNAAVQHFHDLGPCWIDRLSLFVEPHKGHDFLLLSQASLRQ